MSNFSHGTMATAGTLAQGAQNYMAPEILELCQKSNGTHSPLRHTEESDIYSFAQVCWHVRHILSSSSSTRVKLLLYSRSSQAKNLPSAQRNTLHNAPIAIMHFPINYGTACRLAGVTMPISDLLPRQLFIFSTSMPNGFHRRLHRNRTLIDFP